MLDTLTPDQWLLIAGLYIVFLIGFIAYKKIRGRGKIAVLVLRPSKSYCVMKKKVKGNKVEFTEWERHPEFDTSDIYAEEKSWWRFWRLPNQLLVIPEGAKLALKWGEHTLGSIFTKKERDEIIAKSVAKARIQGHIISPTWALVIVGMLGILMVLVYMGFKNVGGF